MPVFEWEEKYHQLLKCRMVGTLCVCERARDREKKRQAETEIGKNSTIISKLFRNTRLKENTEWASHIHPYISDGPQANLFTA